MGDRTAIAWTDATWNPWQGCHKVSLGCRECYMFREKKAYGQDPDVVVRSKPQTFNLPLRLKEPQRVFTCSWSDWFIEEADPWRDEAWAIVDRTRHLTYQILTKRIERAAGRLPWGAGTPWPHVQIIVSAENQETADERIPQLLALNVAVRGVSYEPALGPADFAPWLRPRWTDTGERAPWGQELHETRRLGWIIVGGESGPKSRPFDLAWAHSAIAQGKAAGVPVFVKQLGASPRQRVVYGCAVGNEQAPVHLEPLELRDRKGGDMAEWAEDLRVREFPS